MGRLDRRAPGDARAERRRHLPGRGSENRRAHAHRAQHQRRNGARRACLLPARKHQRLKVSISKFVLKKTRNFGEPLGSHKASLN